MIFVNILAAVILGILAKYLWRYASGRRWTLSVPARLLAACLWGTVGLFSLIFLITGITGCDYSLPGVPSPDGEIVARAFCDCCGLKANAIYTSGVELHGAHFRASWSWLRSRLQRTTVFYAGEDAENIQMKWIGNHDLTIRYPTNSDYPSCSSTWEQVKITCETYKLDPNKPFVRFRQGFFSFDRWFW
jgi:hypothetical protein